MALERDVIVIVDVESTCWERHVPNGQTSEIIEIGVCLYEVKTHQRSDKRSILVKPTFSKVSPFCTKLTTLTQEMVDTGISFADACAILQDHYRASERVWGSWGDYDRRMFHDQCQMMGVAYPFSAAHLNIKQRFANLTAPKRLGMARALQYAGFALDGTHHRGDDDAWNIAKLVRYMHEQYGEAALATVDDGSDKNV